MAIVEDELGASSVFADRSKLDFNYVPLDLPHREEELRALASVFKQVADRSASQSAFVTGSVGTGKTVLTKKFASDFQEASRKRQQNVEYVHVNCRRNASEGLVLHAILKHFDPKYPERGFSTNEMMRDLRKQLERRGCHLLVVLDEADALVAKEGSDLVYSFTRFDDERAAPKATLSLILVSAEDTMPLRLDAAARSTFRRSNTIALPPYNAKQLTAIVAQRAKIAFHKGAIDDDVIDLIAEIAGEDGDARYAIELLDHAGWLADQDGDEEVTPEHVRAAKANTRSFVTEDKVKLLGVHQLFTLKGIARKLGRPRAKAHLTTGEAEEAYKLVAEEHDQTPRAHTQYWKYLNELEVAGWIRLKEAPRTGTSGNTQLVSLPDIPARILVKKIDEVLAKEAKG
ncbi:MAG: AAA family ATPase [Euryarchaeota archaeon]|nr:AAA family ATPase [Euryarchaeota archaeon]